MPDTASVRRNMVDTQLRTYDVTSRRLLDAVESLPREAFVPSGFEALAYTDRTMTVSAGGKIRNLLQPMVLARLLQALDVKTGDKLLDCAGGSGYGAALAAAMGARVTAVEESEAMAGLMRDRLASVGRTDIDVRSGGFAEAAGTAAPFDVIVVHGAMDGEPEDLMRLLADGGRLGAFIGSGRAGRAVVITRSGAAFGRKTAFDAAAAPLVPAGGAPAFNF